MRRGVTDKLSLDLLVDGLIDAYVDWRVACDGVHQAYRVWALEMGSADRVTFQMYMAALDAEEHAAEVYASFVMRAYERLWGEGTSAEAFGEPAGGTGRP